jgi:cytochrome c oxidase subunit 4
LADNAQEHHASAKSYVIVGIVLMVLALVTYLLGEGRLPRVWALPVAMLIAVIKAGLVLIFFMHLGESKGAVRVTALIAASFILILIFFTISDAATRYPGTNPTGAPFGIEAIHAERHTQSGTNAQAR